jgi:NAD(P)H-dependent FMN reductase
MPKYNRLVPAGLNNAIDVGPQPYGSIVWGGKEGAVIGATRNPANAGHSRLAPEALRGARSALTRAKDWRRNNRARTP